MIKKVINISGLAGSGKDTFADMLQKAMERANLKVMRINYADFLKFICTKLFNWDGEKDEHGRMLLQFVGTDMVRQREPNYWVATVANMAAIFDEEFDYVICADCRFPNENDYWREHSFETTTINIIRDNYESALTEEQKLHLSETSMKDYPFEYAVVNDTLEGLEESAEVIAKEIIELDKLEPQDFIPETKIHLVK